MKNFIFMLSLLSFVSALAGEMSYLQCEHEQKKDFLLLTKSNNTWGGFINRVGTGYVSADSCYSLKDAPEEVLQVLKDKQNVSTLCVFITGDDGSGDMVIVRTGSKPSVELQYIDINDLNAKDSQKLKCY